jgi:hypothetical protein
MPYQLNLYNRESLVLVQDGNTETSKTSLTFVGKNFAGYGGIQNENFLYLLENFSNSSPPSNPITGQIWYDTGTRKLRFYDKTYLGGSPETTTYAKWRPVGAEIGSVQPGGMTVGDFWFDTESKQLKAYVGGATPFILIGPQSVAQGGQTNLESVTVKGSLPNTTYPIVKAVVNGETVFVISQNQFTLDPTESLTSLNAFGFISQGITLTNSVTGNTTSSHRFWGTASNASKLGNILASDYVTKSGAIFSNLATFDNAGLSINGIIKLSIDNSEATIENISSKVLSFRIKDTDNSIKNPLRIDGVNVIPGPKFGNPAVSIYNLGTVTDKWNEVYAKNINVETLTVTGAVTATSARADTLYHSGANNGQGGYVSSSIANNGNTVVVRNAAGDFAANIITATVTRAQYADLAEKYDADAIYEPGTVVVFGGEKEITVTDLPEDARVAGVISTNPAYLMNSESDGLAVALRGKVPCKVVGPVQKGDILVSSSIPGYAMAGNTASLPATIIGKSLENKVDDAFGNIMIVVT